LGIPSQRLFVAHQQGSLSRNENQDVLKKRPRVLWQHRKGKLYFLISYRHKEKCKKENIMENNKVDDVSLGLLNELLDELTTARTSAKK
jgi:hypothetical protein